LGQLGSLQPTLEPSQDSKLSAPSVLQLIQATQPTMLNITTQLDWLRNRVHELEQQERYDDCDALFAEFSEWFVTGSDADNTVILVPSPTV